MGKYMWKKDHKKLGQPFLDQHCPTSRSCCFSLPPNIGTIVISLLGLFISTFYILFFFMGEEYLLKIPVDKITAVIIMHVYAVVGILLFSAHILLLTGAIIFSEVLLLLYLWAMILYFLVDFTIVLYVSIKLFTEEHLITGSLILIVSIIYWLFLYHFVVSVVNGFRRSIHTVVIVIT